MTVPDLESPAKLREKIDRYQVTLIKLYREAETLDKLIHDSLIKFQKALMDPKKTYAMVEATGILDQQARQLSVIRENIHRYEGFEAFAKRRLEGSK
jgi:hypothetical protein